jgi:hypothetical protein
MYVFVYGAFFAVPIFFFSAAFLQTVSFMQRPEDEAFTMKSLGRYYFKLFFRFMPFNFFVLILALYLIPYLGTGPNWRFYE